MTFLFNSMNVNYLHVKGYYGARGNGRLTCYSHCYVTWYPLTIWILTSQCQSSRDVEFVIRNLRTLIPGSFNAAKTIIPQSNMFTVDLCTAFKVMLLILTAMGHQISIFVTWIKVPGRSFRHSGRHFALRRIQLILSWFPPDLLPNYMKITIDVLMKYGFSSSAPQIYQTSVSILISK